MSGRVYRCCFRPRAIAAGFIFAVLLLFLGAGFFKPLSEVLRLGITKNGDFTLERLKGILSDPYVRHLIRFTLEQALISAALSFALGFPLGWLIARYEFRGRELLRAFTLVPFVLPPITVALGFVLFFGRSGYLNRALMGALGLGEPPLRLLFSLWAIVLAHAFYNAPVFARFVAAAWEGMDPEPIEAARTLGATLFWSFLTVTLPRLLPAIASAFSLVFIFCFLSFAIPLTLGGARYATLEVGVYLFARVNLDLPGAAALALLELAISLLFAYHYLKGGGVFAARTTPGKSFPKVRLFSRPAHILWAGYLTVAALVFLGPMGAVVGDSFLRGGGPTLRWYRVILSPSYSPYIGASYLGAVGTGILVATASATGALILGLLISRGLRWVRRFPGARGLEVVLLAPLAVSSVVLGLAILLSFKSWPLSLLRGTPWGIVLAHILLTYPFVVRLVGPIWDSLDPSLHEAARTLGADPLWAFFTVELPLLSRALAAAWAFSFALSLGEMATVAMLSRPGLVTIPLAIYQLIGGRQFGAASAMATLLIFITVTVVFLWEALATRSRVHTA
ncbi:TPA: iron ABC transporter permease [Candidatus Micrarchaeota archaeon]|nr:iron ABC transporter permease [Candidatus Micrarchaeota archaeon]